MVNRNYLGPREGMGVGGVAMSRVYRMVVIRHSRTLLTVSCYPPHFSIPAPVLFLQTVFFLFIFKNFYLFVTERKSMSREGQRERETKSEVGSRL